MNLIPHKPANETDWIPEIKNLLKALGALNLEPLSKARQEQYADHLERLLISYEVHDAKVCEQEKHHG